MFVYLLAFFHRYSLWIDYASFLTVTRWRHWTELATFWQCILCHHLVFSDLYRKLIAALYILNYIPFTHVLIVNMVLSSDTLSHHALTCLVCFLLNIFISVHLIWNGAVVFINAIAAVPFLRMSSFIVVIKFNSWINAGHVF